MKHIKPLDQLARMFSKNYAVVSLKFVREHLAHPEYPHAIATAKTLLKKAGFVRGRQIQLPEPNNPCGFTSALCYWRKDYFDGHTPNNEVMREMVDMKLASENGPIIIPFADADEALCGDQPDNDDFVPHDFNIAEMTLITRHLLDETIKNYLRTLPVSHQRAFCTLFETVHCDLSGVCTLTDEDGTVHTFQAMPLPEEARRYYNVLMNMFYQDEERWGPFVLWLEEQSKPVDDSWKKLLQEPYSESLQRSYFFLADLQRLFAEKSTALIEARFSH